MIRNLDEGLNFREVKSVSTSNENLDHEMRNRGIGYAVIEKKETESLLTHCFTVIIQPQSDQDREKERVYPWEVARAILLAQLQK